MTRAGSKKPNAPDSLAFKNPMRCNRRACHPGLKCKSRLNHLIQRKLTHCLWDNFESGPVWITSTWNIPVTLAYQYGWVIVDAQHMWLTPENRCFTSYKQVYPTSSCIAPCLNLHTMPRVAHIAAYMVVSLLLVSDRSYTSPRALDQCFEPPRRVQCLNLPSSTSTRYREKHRTTPLPHRWVKTPLN